MLEKESCRELCKKLNILPLVSEFLLSLLSFIADNKEKFQTNFDTQVVDIFATVLWRAQLQWKWMDRCVNRQIHRETGKRYMADKMAG
jgi:hypothetical protein